MFLMDNVCTIYLGCVFELVVFGKDSVNLTRTDPHLRSLALFFCLCKEALIRSNSQTCCHLSKQSLFKFHLRG